MCGIQLPEGLKESDKLPEPIYTPSTKAEIATTTRTSPTKRASRCWKSSSPATARSNATKLRDYTIALYKKCAEYALSRGIIIADTKFEFGLDENGNVVLGDEMLTPDPPASGRWRATSRATASPLLISSSFATGSRPTPTATTTCRRT